MPVTHTNRREQTYYLHRGLRKSGKPHYYFSQKADGDLAESVPEGYEVYETPGGQVVLRKAVARNVSPEEVAVVEAGVRDRAGLSVYRIDPETSSIVVYLPDQSREEIERMCEEFGTFPRSGLIEKMQRRSSFSPRMRFVLVDQEKRHFRVERWCFLGSIDNWGPPLNYGDLGSLVAKYARHLGKESFFDLM